MKSAITLKLIAACALVLCAAGAFSQNLETGKKPAAQAAASMTDAEVRKVDRQNNKITLKHADIKNLDMPAMTMVFQVREPALLDNLQAGDKVRFSADKIGGAYTVLSIEPAP